MMKRLASCVLFCLLVAATADAQVVSPQYQPRPPVSPYLNMLRGGNPAINYYGVVRPQAQTAQALQQLQNQQLVLPTVRANVPLTDDDLTLGVPTTGHPVQFMNYGQFFPQPGNRTGAGAMIRGNAGSGYIRR
jgi:hypothetical protein